MKTFSKINCWLWPVVLCSTLTAQADPAKTASTKAPAKYEPIRSVFVMPTSPKEGRDPFFPQSLRVYEAINPATPVPVAHVAEITSLKIKGYSIVNGQPMIILNNHAFLAGDEGDVLTSSGRMHVRCVEIKNNTAVIEAGGQRLYLQF